MRTATRLAPKLLLIVGSVAMGAAGAIALRADLVVRYGVSKALEDRTSPAFFTLAASARRMTKAEVGDEVYWLTRGGGPAATPVAFGERLAVGDRIAVTGRDGSTRRLEVVDLRPVGAPIHNVADAPALARLVQVTCRVVGPVSARANLEPVRFYIEAEAAKPATLPAERAPARQLRQG